MELISVIIPAYNVEPYIEKCLCSVVHQTYDNLQIIIINDGSTDGTNLICEKYAKEDNRILYISQQNMGLSMTRNKGLDLVKGSWIFFVDSDDWIEPDTMKSMYSLAVEKNADIVCCGVECVEKDGYISPFTEGNDAIFDNRNALHHMMKSKDICSVIWNKLYRSSLWNNIYFPLYKIHEDEFVTYQVLYACQKVIYTNTVFYHYVQREHSIMSHLAGSNCLNKIEAIEERKQFFLQHGEEGLVDDSCMEGITYIKYLYRDNLVNKHDDHFAQILLNLYTQQMKFVSQRKDIKTITKVTALIWKFILPIQYRLKTQKR